MCHIGCLVSCSIICGFTSNIISAYHSPTHLEPNGMSPLLPLAIKSEFPIRWKKGREIVSCSKSRWHVRWMGVCPTHWHVAIPNERDSFCLNKILTRDRLSPSASESGLCLLWLFTKAHNRLSHSLLICRPRQTERRDGSLYLLVIANGYCCDDCRAPAREKWRKLSRSPQLPRKPIWGCYCNYVKLLSGGVRISCEGG